MVLLPVIVPEMVGLLPCVTDDETEKLLMVKVGAEAVTVKFFVTTVWSLLAVRTKV